MERTNPGRGAIHLFGNGVIVLILSVAYLGFLSPAFAAIAQVGVSEEGYTPPDITVNAGDTVDWYFRMGTLNRHSVTANDGAFDSAPFGCSNGLCPSATFSHTFYQPGTYFYHCQVVPGMVGVVRVSSASSPGGSAGPPPPSGPAPASGPGPAPAPAAPNQQTGNGAPPAPPAPPPSGGSSASSSYTPSQTRPADPLQPPGAPASNGQVSSSAAGAQPAASASPLADASPGALTAQAADASAYGSIPTIVLPELTRPAHNQANYRLRWVKQGIGPIALLALALGLVLVGTIYGTTLKKRILKAAGLIGPGTVLPAGVPDGFAGTGEGSLLLAPGIPAPGNPSESAHVVHAVALKPVAPPATPVEVPAAAAEDKAGGNARLMLEGDIWTLEYAGHLLRLNDSKGLGDLTKLLLHPGREFHVMDLASDGAGPATRGPDPAEGLHAAPQDAGAVLDGQAKQSYRRKLQELDQEIEEAQSDNDFERASKAAEDKDFIMQELARAVGLGGKDRKALSDLDRARVLVTKRIRRSIEKIKSKDYALGRHLEDCVKTGTYCVYRHDPDFAVRWERQSAP